MVAKTVSSIFIIVIIGRRNVCNRQCKEDCKHNNRLAIADIPVREESKHNYKQKQKPIIIEHIFTRIFLSRYAHICANVQMREAKDMTKRLIIPYRPPKERKIHMRAQFRMYLWKI